MKNLYSIKTPFLTILVMLMIVLGANAQSSVPSRKMSMQGFLKDANGKAVVDGNKVLTFKIYDAQTNGTTLWTNVFSTVPVIGGVYAVQLGTGKNAANVDTEISSLPWNVPYFVGITVESEPELAPRTEFTYAPYTFAVNKATLADIATRALTADGVGGGVNLAVNNSDANIRIIKNSTSSIDRDIYLGLGSGSTSSLHLFSNNNETMTVAGGNINATGNVNANGNVSANGNIFANNVITIGNIGVGTTTPEASLDVVRGVKSGTAIFRGSQYTSNFNSGAGEDTHIRGGKAGATVYINEGNSGSVLLSPGGGGYVGIGTYNAQAPLHVSSSYPQYNNSAYRAFNLNSANIVDNSLFFAVVRVDGSIWSNGGAFIATSDKRIKNIIGLTNTATDLAILNKIEITDYKYKDEISNGGGLQKKVIAQQLQEIYPRAINTTKGIIPNVFAVAKETKVLDQSTIITTTKPHDFASGDKVKLILEKTGEKELIVTVIDATTFSVAEALNDKVFVYGKNVNDLLTVDYDAVSMLNVSATQELSKQIEQLKAENAKIKSENKTYENRLMKIEAMLQIGGNLGTGK